MWELSIYVIKAYPRHGDWRVEAWPGWLQTPLLETFCSLRRSCKKIIRGLRFSVPSIMMGVSLLRFTCFLLQVSLTNDS